MITIIKYRCYSGTEFIIAMSGDTPLIEGAISKAKDRVAELGISAYERREKAEQDGTIKHDPGRSIDGFPQWQDIYQEELKAVGIASNTQSNIVCYATQPFEKYEQKLMKRMESKHEN